MDSMLQWLPLVLSAIAIVVAARTSQSQSALQRRLVEIEEERDRIRESEVTSARLVAEIEGGFRATRLYIMNVGAASARDIAISLDGAAAEQNPHFKGRIPKDFVLESGGRHSFPLLMWDGGPHTLRIGVTWTSEHGVPGRFDSHVSIV